MKSIGDFEVSPAKTRIAFQTRMRFAAVNYIGRDFIRGHIILTKPSDSSKFYRIELNIVHHFRLDEPEDIDQEFIGFMKEAYAVGWQAHPTSMPGKD